MIIIAEIGTAHSGSLEKARALIEEAAQSGADCVKFQWVYADEILHPDTGFVKLPGGNIRLYDRFKALEVEPAFFKSCLEYAHQKGLLFACSPFGLRSLQELVAIEPDAIKIASPEVNHYPMLQAAAQYYGRIPIILSSGVSKLGDIEKAISILQGSHATAWTAENTSTKLPPLTLLHCITSYPAPESEYNVRCVDTLRQIFGIPTGISDHSLDEVLVPTLTTAMGGSMIEKHITLSRKTDGLDDPVALEGEPFAHMVHCVHQAEAVLRHFGGSAVAEIKRQLAEQYGAEKIETVSGTGIKRLAPSELANYGRTNRSLHYTRSLKKGQKITTADIAVLRTEKVLTPGLSPEYLQTVTGAVLQQDVSSGEGVCWEHFISK